MPVLIQTVESASGFRQYCSRVIDRAMQLHVPDAPPSGWVEPRADQEGASAGEQKPIQRKGRSRPIGERFMEGTNVQMVQMGFAKGRDMNCMPHEAWFMRGPGKYPVDTRHITETYMPSADGMGRGGGGSQRNTPRLKNGGE